MTRPAWPRAKRCQADTGGRHRWEYAKDRTSRTCVKCGTGQAAGEPAASTWRELRW